MHTIAIANHKGGVGKSTTARALADVLSSSGLRVLLVDSDHQGTLSLSCGITDANPCLANLYAVAGRPALPLAKIIKNITPGLDLAPASLALAKADSELSSRLAKDFILADALESVAGAYDIALIDCPPALGELVSNALIAANSVLIPSLAQPVDVAGVEMFLQTIDAIRASPRLNPGLIILGILLTFYDRRLKIHRSSRAAMEAAGWPVLSIVIPRSVRVAEAPALSRSIITFDPKGLAAAAYAELGEVIIKWLKDKQN